MALTLSATLKLNQFRGPTVILGRVQNGKWGTGNRYCCLQSARVLFFFCFCCHLIYNLVSPEIVKFDAMYFLVYGYMWQRMETPHCGMYYKKIKMRLQN